MTEKLSSTRKFESACPKCHRSLTIELDVEPSAERGVVVTCDHCGVTKRLAAFHREMARQVRESEKKAQRAAEQQERLEFARKQAEDVAQVAEQLRAKREADRTASEEHPPSADVKPDAPLAEITTPPESSKSPSHRTKVIVAVANAVIVAVAGIIYLLVYYGPPPHNAELAQRKAAYRGAIMRAAVGNNQNSSTSTEKLDRAVDLAVAIVDRGKVTAQYACEGIGGSLDTIGINPEWTPEFVEEILQLGKVIELSSEAQNEEILNPPTSLIAAVKKARWFNTVARTCRNEEPHDVAKLIAGYMLCKKYGEDRAAFQNGIEANNSGAAATCLQACLKRAWADTSISP